MKKLYLIVSLFLIMPLAAQERMVDKPALSRAEWIASYAARGLGVKLGAGAGMAVAPYAIGVPKLMLDADKPFHERMDFASLNQTVALSRAGGAIVGTVSGFKLSRPAFIYAMARRHAVSYKVEQISQFYNINLGQYGLLLIAAEKKNPSGIKAAIANIFPQRFGPDWKEQLVRWFDIYAKSWTLLNWKLFGKTQDEKDFIRMVELGAAMANIYFDSKPNKKTMLSNAIKFYKELDFLE